MSECEKKRKMKGLAPCKSDKICNPKSGRCVLKSGRIGKALLKKSKSKRKSVRKSKSRRKSIRRRRKSVRKSKSKSRRKSVRKSKSRRKSIRRRRKSVRKSKSKIKSKIKSKSKQKKLKKNQLPYKGNLMAAARARDMKAMQQIQAWNAQQLMGDISSSSSSEEIVPVEGEGILNVKVLNYITGKNITIGKWLKQSPENFVMEVAPGKWEICSLDLMRMALKMNVNPDDHPNIQLFSDLWQSLFTVWYECPRSGVGGAHLPIYYRGPQINTDADHQFVKIGTANWVVLRPNWFPEGQIPGSRIFRLEKLRKVNGLVTNYAREGNMSRLNLMSVDHCNQKSPIQTYRLVEYN